MNHSDTRCIVIGGGIGGLTAALALRRVGVAVSVFEQAPAIEAVGAGISLWSNAMQALRQVGVDERIAALGTRLTGGHVMTSGGKRLSRMAYRDITPPDAAPSVCVHRADLQGALLEALGDDDLTTGAACTGVETNDGEAVAAFADGRRERADMLIGADGIHSAVRRNLFGDEATRYAGHTCWRGMCPYENDELSRGESVLTIGRGGKFGLFPCGDGRAYWFAVHQCPAKGTDGDDGRKADVLRLIDGWRGPAIDAVTATDESAILRNDLVDRPPRQAWGRGRVTLLGDSIHATTPNLGQGACQAIESAITLAACVRDGDDLEATLRAYESRRRARTAMVTRQSWKLGRTLVMRQPLLIAARDLALRTPLAGLQARRLFRTLLNHCSPSL